MDDSVNTGLVNDDVKSDGGEVAVKIVIEEPEIHEETKTSASTKV